MLGSTGPQTLIFQPKTLPGDVVAIADISEHPARKGLFMNLSARLWGLGFRVRGGRQIYEGSGFQELGFRASGLPLNRPGF